MGRVEGKVAFITGAARGQGRSHAIRLAEEGADIIALDLCGQTATVRYPLATPEDLQQTVEAVQALGRRIVARQADVRDLTAVKEVVEEGVAELGGRLDIVAANAGISSSDRNTTAISEEDWSEMLDINLTGVWHTTKAAIPHMIAAGNGGSIVLTSSAAGLKAYYPGLGHYVAAKHGVVGLMRALAAELAPRMIRVNSIHPTNVDTGMIQNEHFWRIFSPGEENPTKETSARVAQSMNAMPLPWVEARDISNALLFLTSDESRYITGVPLPVDAGVLIR